MFALPEIMAWLGRVLLTAAGEWLVRMVVGAGLAFATNEVVTSTILPTIRAEISQRFAGAGELVGYIGWFGIDKAVTIILSAWAARFAVNAAKVALVKTGGSGGGTGMTGSGS